MRKTRAINQKINIERKREVAKNKRHKSGEKFRKREREKLRKTRAINQERNLERKREVAKNMRHKSGNKSREEERSCEKHAPNSVNISGGFTILIPKYTAFIENKRRYLRIIIYFF